MIKKNKNIAKFGVIVISLSLVLSVSQKLNAQTWSGVDETVVEKFAEEAGRKAWKPFINTDQGDMLLFVFLLAGAAGGFVLGFYWHKLFCGIKTEKRENA